MNPHCKSQEYIYIYIPSLLLSHVAQQVLGHHHARPIVKSGKRIMLRSRSKLQLRVMHLLRVELLKLLLCVHLLLLLLRRRRGVGQPIMASRKRRRGRKGLLPSSIGSGNRRHESSGKLSRRKSLLLLGDRHLATRNRTREIIRRNKFG
jgi:hypothetical protein